MGEQLVVIGQGKTEFRKAVEYLMYNFIDVEASGFGAGSYPIEVGVALAGGQSHCTLVRPQEHWVHWQADAEALHGISRETLLLAGRAPLEVALLLNQWLDGQTVYTDAWGNDSCWLSLLFDEAGLVQRFRLESIVAILTPGQQAQWHAKKDQVRTAQRLGRHRASKDALVLQCTLAELTSQDCANY